MKGQHLADFAVELPQLVSNSKWSLFLDGASGRVEGGARIVLEGPDGFLLEYALVFKFKTSNNQAEYKALVAVLELAKDMGVHNLICHTDSRLVVGQMNNEFQIRDDHLIRYFHRASTLVEGFNSIEIKHIPRGDNARAYLLSKLSQGKEKGQLATIIRQVLLQPPVECLNASTQMKDDCRNEIRQLIARQDRGEAISPINFRKIVRYVIIGGDLYRRGFSTPSSNAYQ